MIKTIFYVVGWFGLALGIWGICTDGRRVNPKVVLFIAVLLALTLPVSADGGDIIIADPCDVCFDSYPWYVCWLRGCCWLIIAPCD